MRRSSFILALIAVLWFTGCQEKFPVELALDQSAAALEVKVLPAIDSTLIIDASVDTSGVLQYRGAVVSCDLPRERCED